MQYIKINEAIAELINAHGYNTTITRDKIIPEFKDKIELDTRVFPRQNENIIQTRFDIEVSLKNGMRLYESFGDFGRDVYEAINKNIENFSRSSLHVFIDAFNDTNTYCGKVEWQIRDNIFDVYVGSYNIKSSGNKQIELPIELYKEIQDIIIHTNLNEEYFFIRFFYAHNQNKVMTTEFMINNVNVETAQEKLENLNWMKSDEFYSVRNFIILKLVKK